MEGKGTELCWDYLKICETHAEHLKQGQRLIRHWSTGKLEWVDVSQDSSDRISNKNHDHGSGHSSSTVEAAGSTKVLPKNEIIIDKAFRDSCIITAIPTLADFMGKEGYEMYIKAIEEAEEQVKLKYEAQQQSSKFRNRPLVEEKAVFSQNAWDDVDWDDEQKTEAILKVENNSKTMVDEVQRVQLDDNAADNWTKFYEIHQNKFFRDRRWLFKEFPDLVGPFGSSFDSTMSESEIEKKRQNETFVGENSNFRILEVGCGNGSTVFPLLMYNNHPELYVYCCDFSSKAVQVVSESPHLETNRCTPFVWDITKENPNLPFPLESLDIVVIIFVLSAISPEKFDQVFQNLYKILKPNGLILFRDYGLYDLVQLRIGPGRCISDNFYFRGDGTRVYFFTEDEVEDIFKRNGYTKLDIIVDKRLQVNRLKKIKMFRVWVQGRFQKISSSLNSSI